MTSDRWNKVAKEILFFFLDRDKCLALNLDCEAEKIASARKVTEEEVRQVLHHFVREARRERSH